VEACLQFAPESLARKEHAVGGDGVAEARQRRIGRVEAVY
jgi:hypothetical protein